MQLKSFFCFVCIIDGFLYRPILNHLLILIYILYVPTPFSRQYGRVTIRIALQIVVCVFVFVFVCVYVYIMVSITIAEWRILFTMLLSHQKRGEMNFCRWSIKKKIKTFENKHPKKEEWTEKKTKKKTEEMPTTFKSGKTELHIDSKRLGTSIFLLPFV